MGVRLKDPFAAVSHWVGLALALAGTSWLASASLDKPLHLFAFTVYGLGVMALYGASATYHSLHGRGWWAGGLQKLDHAAIFVMIAASYAPLCLIAIRGATGMAMLGFQSAFAVIGVTLTMKLKKVPGLVRVILYLTMGWMAVFVLGPLSRSVPAAGLGWLVAGGVVYTVGAVIYVTDRPSLWPGRFSAHDLWHVFVLAGSACHFVLFARFLAPAQ
jgi:hemolysin III